MNFFSTSNTALTLLGYSMSWLELVATIFTIACVWLAIIRHILNWPVALVAIALSFLLFYQSQLYSDCFLQVYFFVTSIYGWWNWGRKGEEPELPVTLLTGAQRLYLAGTILIFTGIASYGTMHLNTWWPKYFPQPAAFPIPDSFIMVTSIAGQWLLAKKKVESWYCWVVVNFTAVLVYFLKDIKLFSLLYLALLVMAVGGIRNWKKAYNPGSERRE
jgi:nicotinamide mononucleotide transporter